MDRCAPSRRRARAGALPHPCSRAANRHYAPNADVDGLPSPPFPSQIEQLLSGVIISEEEVRVICEKAKEVLSKEENVVPVAAPVTVVRPRPTPTGPSIFFLRAERATARLAIFFHPRGDAAQLHPFRVSLDPPTGSSHHPRARSRSPALTPSPSPPPARSFRLETSTASSPTSWR